MAPRSVLVVDDDGVHCDIFVKTVKALGHKATGAPSGAAALAELQAGTFDLVLLAVNLADLSGITITREIRASAVRQPVIIGLLADEDEDAYDACVEAGMDGVISKIGSMGLLRRYLPSAAKTPARRGADSVTGTRPLQ